jgi:PAS domain S-box-containing protein
MMSAFQVLLLEESLSDAERIKVALAEGGITCELLRVETRPDFIAALETDRFDLVLANHALSGFDGLAALEIVCNSPDVPFIFVSASVGEERVIEAFERGAAGYVLKHRLEQLVPLVQRVLQNAQARYQRQQTEAVSDMVRLRLAAQKEVLELAASEASIDVVLDQIVRTTQAVVGQEARVVLFIVDAEGARLRFGATAGMSESYVRAMDGFEIKPDNPSCGTAAYTGNPVIVKDVVTDPLWSPYLELAQEHGIRACWSFPIRSFTGKVLGTLAVYHGSPEEPEPHTFESISLLAQTAALTIEQCKTTDSLRQSEARFRMVAANLPNAAVFIVDRDLRYLMAGGKAIETAGINPESLTSKTIWEALDPALATDYEPYYRQGLQGKPFRLEHYSHDRYYISYGTPLYNDRNEVDAVLVVSYDITDRKKVEQERERFLAIGSDFQVITDINGYFRWISPTFERALGWTVSEMTSHPWIEFVHSDDIDASISETNSLFSGNETMAFENRYRHKDGSYRWFRWNAKLYPKEQVVYGTAVDITDRKQTEEDLRQKNAILNVINESTPTPIFVKDRQGRIIYANPATLEVLEKSASEVIGYRDCDLYPNYEDAARVMENDRRIMETGQMEVVEESPDGIRTFLGIKVPYRSETGEVIGLIGISNDITERVQLEQDRERVLQQEQIARATAEQANRIKDEFLAVLSHELRSPLNPILGWSKLLQTGKLSAAKTRQALVAIERNAKLQAQLIEDLLDVSRILRGKLNLTMNPVNLAFIIREAIETVQLAAEAKLIQIAVNLDSEVRLVLGDATRLQQVVWNLLANAIKFTPAGGQVEIRLSWVTRHSSWQEDGQPETNNQGQRAEYAQITVSDNGIGISPDFLSHVFDYFRQADSTTTRQFGGLGLGLAIVRHLTELHGGTIQADSPGEGLGATFTLRLPCQPTQPPIEPDPYQREPSRNLNGVQVLLVDDETDTREFIAFLLEQAGARVTAVTTAAEAMTALTETKPDLLLSDIGMPKTNGYMLMQQVRSLPADQGGQILAIALTAYAGDFNQQKALQAGFQQHIAKPVEPEALLKAIATLLGNRRTG